MVQEVYLDREKGLLNASLIPYFSLSPVQLHRPFFVPIERVLISFRENE